MPTSGHNEADARAKPTDPALHKSYWVEQVTATERETHGEIRRRQSPIRIEILDGTQCPHDAAVAHPGGGGLTA